MNYHLFISSAVGAGKTLYAGWSYKAALAAILAVLLNKHALLFYAFATLFFFGLFDQMDSNLSQLSCKMWRSTNAAPIADWHQRCAKSGRNKIRSDEAQIFGKNLRISALHNGGSQR